MPQKEKVSTTLKVEACKKYLTESISIADIAKALEVDGKIVRRWIFQYQSEGKSGLEPQKHNRVYPPKLKLAAVTDYLQGNDSLLDICKKYQIHSDCQLSRWLKQYNGHEEFKLRSGGSRIMSKARKTTQTNRVEIVEYCLAHDMNYGETALKYQVSYQQVYQWTKKYLEMGKMGLEDRRGHRVGTLSGRTPQEELEAEVAQLKHKNWRLQMEVDVLKKLQELERRDVLALRGKNENTKR